MNILKYLRPEHAVPIQQVQTCVATPLHHLADNDDNDEEDDDDNDGDDDDDDDDDDDNRPTGPDNPFPPSFAEHQGHH